MPSSFNFNLRLTINSSKIWKQFALDILGISSESFQKIRKKSKKVRAVCFHNNEPVIITSDTINEFSYDSVIDIALSYVEKNNIKIG